MTTDLSIVQTSLISTGLEPCHLYGIQVSDLCTVFDEPVPIVSFWGTCTLDDARKAFAG